MRAGERGGGVDVWGQRSEEVLRGGSRAPGQREWRETGVGGERAGRSNAGRGGWGGGRVEDCPRRVACEGRCGAD